MSRNDTTPLLRLINIILVSLVVVLVLRIVMFNRVALFILLGLAALIGLVWGIVKYVQLARRQRSPQGIIERRQDWCRSQLSRHQREIAEIKRSMKDLYRQLDEGKALTQKQRDELKRLLHEYRAELDLRQAKVAFYQACIEKLDMLQQHLELTETLLEKKARLKAMREADQEELADLEALKKDIALDKGWLQSFEQLTQRIEQSHTLDDARSIQLELEEMTRELEEL